MDKSKGNWRVVDHVIRSEPKSGPAYCVDDGFYLNVFWEVDLEQPAGVALDHVNPYLSIPPRIVSRDTPNCYVSNALGDHVKDWDFLVEWRNKVWEMHGVTETSSLWDKVRAVAHESAHITDDKHRPINIFEHPVDGIIKGAFCAGKACITVAVCSTFGLEGRNVSVFKHEVCEIRIDGKWRFVESMTKDGNEHFVSELSFIEFLEAPDADARFSQEVRESYKSVFEMHRRDVLYILGTGRYWWFTGLAGERMNLHYVPEVAHALYPSLKRYPAPTVTCRQSPRPLERFHGLFPAPPLRVTQDKGLRRSVYLGKLPDLLTTRLFFAPDLPYDFPEDGGDWYVRVNGSKHSLRDLNGGDLLRKFTMPQHYLYYKGEFPGLMLNLPSTDLLPNQVNTFELRCDSPGEQFFHALTFRDFLQPAAKVVSGG